MNIFVYLNFSTVGLAGVLLAEENPLSLSEESPNLRESQSLNGLRKHYESTFKTWLYKETYNKKL